jgi:hypothetical protein
MTFKDAGIRNFKKILVLTEGGEINNFVFETAMLMAKQYDAWLEVGAWMPEDSTEKEMDRVTSLIANMEKSAGLPKSGHKIFHGSSEFSDLSQATVDYDLMVIDSNKKRKTRFAGLFASLEDRLVKESACSVVCIKLPGRGYNVAKV